MSGKKNLIMGVWMRQRFRLMERFIASLRHSALDADVCIFVDDVSSETIRTLQHHGVIVERIGPRAQPHMPFHSGRFFSYLDFLARHADEYDHVMLTDLRHVVLQSDPFAKPLPTEIVYALQRRRLGDAEELRDCMTQAYGEAVALNMRDCLVSCVGTTVGTASGILRYLVAMTHELSARSQPVTGRIDHAVHNYVARMHPLRDAWVDPTDSIVATMQDMPARSIRVSEQGVLIDGRPVPVLHQWDSNATTAEYVRTAPRFRLDGPAPPRPPARPAATVVPARNAASTRNAVVAFYHRQRDADRLRHFLQSLRNTGYAGGAHCIGAFNPSELELLSQHNCAAYTIAATDPAVADNIAHFYLGQVLDQLAADQATAPDQVLVLDSVRAVFLRDPFLSKTIGLSAFCEGTTRIGESDYNRHRLGLFVPANEGWLQFPVLSSALLRGPLPVLREFYRQLFLEFIGRQDLLATQKVIQGAINKLCYAGFGSPVIVHPNAAEAYFDTSSAQLSISMRPVVRIGGAVPAVVLTGPRENALMRKLAINLGLE